jgi:hypothetical protein
MARRGTVAPVGVIEGELLLLVRLGIDDRSDRSLHADDDLGIFLLLARVEGAHTHGHL